MAARRMAVVRWTMAVSVALAAIVGAGVPAAHAEPGATTAWLGNTQNTPTGVNNNWFISPGGYVHASFGLVGAGARDGDVVLDASDAGGHVTLSNPTNSPCTIAGRVAHCHDPNVSGDTAYFSLQISVDSGAPLDLLGSMVARGPAGDTTAAVHLYAARPESGADLQVDVTGASGQVGDTVQVVVTIRNLGPSPEPYWGIGPINTPPDAELLGVSGCGPRTLSANQYPCGRDDPQRVGTTVTVYLRFRITRRPATIGDIDGGFSFLQAYSDPNPHNLTLYFSVKVAGSAIGSAIGSGGGAGGNSGGGSGSGGGTPADAAVASPAAPAPSVPAPSASAPSATSSPVPASPAGTVTVLARPVSANAASWQIPALSALLVLGGVGYLLLNRRRRRRSAAATPDD